MEGNVAIFGLAVCAGIIVGFTHHIACITTEELKDFAKINIPAELLLRIVHIRTVHEDRYELHVLLLGDCLLVTGYCAISLRAIGSPALSTAIFYPKRGD